MNSIYNDDIAIRNTNKRNNMSNKNNNTQDFAALSADIIADGVEEIANNLDITREERMMILEAAARVRWRTADADLLTDWQRSALAATDERDRLRVLVANQEARIELLVQNINRLERCVIQNALNTSRLASRDEEETDEKIIFHAGRIVQNQINHERQSNDNDGLENGDL